MTDAQRAGVAYFGNRILRHVATDMEGLAADGFGGVLHTFSENDLAWYRGTMGRVVAASHDAGLSVAVAPWGVAQLFGGEAESGFTAANPDVGQVLDDGRSTPAGCPNNPAVRSFVRAWADAAIESGADQVFWDEPHWVHPEHFGLDPDRWGCRCHHCQDRFAVRTGEPMPAELTPEVLAFRQDCLVDFVGDLVGHCAAQGAATTVCLLPLVGGTHGLPDWSAVAALPGLGILATDPYWKAFGEPAGPFVSRFSELVGRLAAGRGVGAQIWIQGFRMEPSDEADIRAAVAAARAAGIEDLWTWGFEACGHMSALAGSDPAAVWKVLRDALTGR
ncbi:MAG: hypothetical protein ACJ782_00070 [Actinomycetota bacterium]